MKCWYALQAKEDPAVTASLFTSSPPPPLPSELGLAGGSAVFVVQAEPVNIREGVTPQKIRQGWSEVAWRGFRCRLQRGVSIHYVFTERGQQWIWNYSSVRKFTWKGGEGKNHSNYVKAVVVVLSAAFLPKSLCHNGKDRGPATKEPKQGTRWS